VSKDINKTLKEYLIENGREKQLELVKEVADKVAYSSGKQIELKCGCCNYTWQMSPNKIIIKKPKNYNFFTKKKEMDVYCPYCNGTRPSVFWNLGVSRLDIKEMYDTWKNQKRLDELTPDTHEKIYIKCKNTNCDYEDVIVPHSTKNIKCPKCSFVSVQDFADKISVTFDEGRNEIKANEIAYASSEKMWWICPKGHNFPARVSNITMLGRGCPYCVSERKTSFVEQAIYYYLRQLEDNIINNQIDEISGESIDILFPDKKIAIEYNSQYRHMHKVNNDITKIKNLSKYYKVYVIAEGENAKELCFLEQGRLINVIKVPIWQGNKTVREEYNLAIMCLIREIYPDLKNIPNVNIEKDSVNIYSLYKKNDLGQKSLEYKYPHIAKLWHPYKNGTLTPKMFPSTESMTKFYWVCGECNESYQRTIGNQMKVENHICKKCFEKKKGRILLQDIYPNIMKYWSKELNDQSLDCITVGSEYMPY